MSDPLYLLSQTLGWLYFGAWSISFYPQVYLNAKRKSVAGLSIDFQFYNLTGFTFYTIYTLVFYVIEQNDAELCCAIQLNDIAFAGHALVLTVITVAQCLIYRKRTHSISQLAAVMQGLLWAGAAICTTLSVLNVLPWFGGHFSTLLYLGYAKAYISLIKYVPQAYLNYKKQNTVGFAIGNILLDLSGGTLALLQQSIDAYRHNDIQIIFGNIPKLLLSLQSVIFDIFFIVQHYILYRRNNLTLKRNEKYKQLNGDDAEQYEDEMSADKIAITPASEEQ